MIIYKIINDVNDKVYIGQTTNTLKERIKQYQNEYKYRKNSRPIISAMNKYGFDKFHFIILENNINSKKELDDKEKYYIQLYNSANSEFGYNVELGGNSAGKHSEETKRKISEAQLGEKNHMFGHCGSLNGKSKSIIELTTGKIYESANLAANELNLGISHVCAVARGERGSHKGYVFRYIDENNNIIQPEKIAKIKFKSAKEKVLSQYKQFIC